MFLYWAPRAAAGCCGPRSRVPSPEAERAPVSPPNVLYPPAKFDPPELLASRLPARGRPLVVGHDHRRSGLAVRSGVRKRGVDEFLVDHRERLLVVDAVALEALQQLGGG